MQKYDQVWKKSEIWNMKLWLVPLIQDQKLHAFISISDENRAI